MRRLIRSSYMAVLAYLWVTACGPNPAPVTPDDVEAARRAFCVLRPAECCVLWPERCVTPRPTPEATSTPTPAPSATPTLAPATATPTPAPTVVEPTKPAPEPTRTPAPPADVCAAVQSLPHTMAPGNKLHAGRARRGLVDSTIRPICDEDHQENWNTFCGKRTHDPDYSRRHGAMEWTVTGAQDLGPNCPDGSDPNDRCENSAQRWISGEPGAQVTVRVCIPANKRTPDGCLIVRQGDGCGSRVFTLPAGD